MMIIGFTRKTSKLLPRIFCHNLKHCAPIEICTGGRMIMYQFVRRGRITRIPLTMRDITLLKASGWEFLYLSGTPITGFTNKYALTCVHFTRNAIGLNKIWLQTPDALKRYLLRYTIN